MKTIDKQDYNTDSEEIIKENEGKSQKEENKTIHLQMTGRLTMKPRYTGPKSYHDYCKDCKDENQKLTTASNIVIALSGVFSAYETMNKEQFEQIVHSFVTSE